LIRQRILGRIVIVFEINIRTRLAVLTIFLVLSLVAGCRDSSTNSQESAEKNSGGVNEATSPPEKAPGKTKQAVALTGCVIIEQDGRIMKYRKKCENCGAIQPGTTTSAIPGKYSKKTSSFTCYKCKKRQKLVIQGS